MLNVPDDSRTAALLVALLVGAFFAARHFGTDGGPPPGDAPTYPAREAADHVGEVARICGTVVDAAYATQVGGDPTFLNFVEPHPDAVFTVVIWRDVRARFEVPPEAAYEGRDVCVTGRVREHEGRPEIVLDEPSQISVPEDPASTGGRDDRAGPTAGDGGRAGGGEADDRGRGGGPYR